MLSIARFPGRAPDLAAVMPRDHELVAFWRCGSRTEPVGHDAATKASVARAIAELLDLPFSDDPADAQPSRSPFVVPSQTLVGRDTARALGIQGPADFFGGVVPDAFMATKVVTHPLVADDAAAPVAWPASLGAQLVDVVLPGWSVFSRRDALIAGLRLLPGGAVRLKAADGVGGSGQSVARDEAELRAQLDAIDPALIRRFGWVLERNLDADVVTHSVGSVQVGRWRAAYCGQQTNTRNRRGEEVYGGSRLLVARGGFDELLALDLPADARVAVEHARHYDRATQAACAGMFASRVNYDVVQGRDADGVQRCGVLEQSWRIGGASGAEVAALLAFKADPSLRSVVASTHEVHADSVAVPPGARIHYDDEDPAIGGRLTKYATVEGHGDT